MLAVADGRLELACSPALLAELSRVVNRPRIAARIPQEDAVILRNLYSESLQFVDPGPDSGRCRDPHDDYLLALAEASNADYLVTRDADLLVLERHGRTEIIYPARFLQLLEKAPP